MARQLLNQVRVASPCTVSWDSMEGDERTRYCGQCKLNVYNISNMTAPEAEDFLRNSVGRVCVRMYQRADGTVMTRDCPVGLAAVRRRIGYAAALSVVMVFGAFSMAMARVKSTDPEAKESIEKLKDRARDWPIIGDLLGKKPPPPVVPAPGGFIMGDIAAPAPSHPAFVVKPKPTSKP